MKDSMLAGEYSLYFEWLINEVGGEEWWGDYVLSLIRLFERKYYFVNKVDEAIYDGALSLRTEAIFNDVDILSIPNDEPSVLEVLIYLSKQIDLHLMFMGDDEVRTPRWFDDLMSVLGFKNEEGSIDHEIDTFLGGSNVIAKPSNCKVFKHYRFTLWEQVNLFYMKQFDLETD